MNIMKSNGLHITLGILIVAAIIGFAKLGYHFGVWLRDVM